ncbi:MAG: tetratricopeptide repeat protein [Pikeienuella sp.]
MQIPMQAISIFVFLLMPLSAFGGASLSICADSNAALQDKATHCARALEKEDLSEKQRWGAYVNLARAHSDLGRYDRAEIAFTTAQEMRPHHLAVYPDRAKVREARGNYDGALADWNVAQMLAPDDIDIQIGRGGFFMRRNEPAQALAEYEAALTNDPEGMDILFNRALALIALDRKDAAVFDLTMVLSTAPNDAEAYYHRGRALTGQDDETALADFIEATTHSPEWSWPWFMAGKTLDQLARRGEALTYYRRAFELGHKDAWLLDRIQSAD